MGTDYFAKCVITQREAACDVVGLLENSNENQS